ncbi:MAG: sulfurtransferase TusA family protein [Gemmatimonadales bacterium]
MRKVLDTNGLNCPLPELKVRKALADVPLGDCLTGHATDPASPIDFRHFCNVSRHELVDASESDGVFTYVIRRTRGRAPHIVPRRDHAAIQIK